MNIQGRGAIVTGGASGLGEAVVAALQEKGARVASLDIAASASADHSFQVDITDEDAIANAIEQAAGALGEINFVINCAGIGIMEPIMTDSGPASLESMRRLLDVNLVGTYNVVRFAAPLMSGNAADEGGERGVIINTSSISALDGPAGFSAYAAS